MLRLNFDVQTAKSVRATESMISEHRTAAQTEINTQDTFVSASQQSRIHSVVNVKAPKEVFISAQWWDQRLIDALPSMPHLGKVEDLDERSKEALRALALAAPHRDLEE